MKVLSAVLIGRNQQTRGVVPRVIPVKGYGDSGPRWDITIEQAVLLGQGSVPVAPQERVVKFITMVDEGSVYMWFGCYCAANFPDNDRGGTYVGAGVLVEGTLISLSAATRYVLQIMAKMRRLVRPDGLLLESVYDLNLDELGVSDTNLFIDAKDDTRIALSAHSTNHLFVDASSEDWVDWSSNTHLGALLARIGRSSQLPKFGAVLISNSKRAALSAADSRRFTVLDPGQAQQAVEAEPLFEQGMAPPRTVPPPPPAKLSPPPLGYEPSAPKAPDLRIVEGLLTSIQQELRSVNAQLVKNGQRKRETAPALERSADDSDWTRPLTIGASVLMAFICGAALGVFLNRF